MRKRRIVCSIAMFLALASSAQVFCHGVLWRFLGDTRIVGEDHDRIQVGGSQGPFRAVQLRVSGDAIFCQKLVVNYSDGTSEELVIGDRMSGGGSARVIDFKGRARILKSIEFWYFKEPWEHIPRVTVYGTR
jgi:hypothetical protein